MFDVKSLKSFDWRSLKKYASPHAADDLNAFLEKLPQHAGQTMLVIAAIVWMGAGAVGLYATVQLQQLAELKAEYEEAEVLQPIVPKIQDAPVNNKDISEFVDKMTQSYTGLTIKANGAAIVITASSTAQFAQFREAVGHVQNGGSGWRVRVERLCVGRECGRDPLAAALKINKVSVKKPG